MSIELMERALEFITGVYFGEHEGSRADREKLEADLTTAIQQAEAQQPATGEPVYQIRKAFSQDAEWAWRDATEELFHMHPKEHRRILYTHPAPGVPDDVVKDAERYRWLRENGTLGFSGAPSWRASVSFDAVDAYAQTLDSNIDAAQAQKGQP